MIRYFTVDGVDALGSLAAKQFDELHNSAFYLKRHEGKTLEYKRDLSSPESILKCLVAFANTGGGIVVIGVEDGSENVRGVPDVLAAAEKLANLVSDSPFGGPICVGEFI